MRRAVTPRLGWRVWTIGYWDRKLFLKSLEGSWWEYGEPIRARCWHRLHPAPQPDCQCGIYAFRNLRDMRGYAAVEARNYVPAVGAVYGWGRIMVHSHGFRTEWAYPAALWLRCDECHGAPDFVDLALHCTAWCRRCLSRSGRRGTWDAREAARQLRKDYDVPVFLGPPPSSAREALRAVRRWNLGSGAE